MNKYISIQNKLPPEGKVVMTKIEDIQGCRNEQSLFYDKGLWWVPSGEMYVYYQPTHWKEV